MSTKHKIAALVGAVSTTLAGCANHGDVALFNGCGTYCFCFNNGCMCGGIGAAISAVTLIKLALGVSLGSWDVAILAGTYVSLFGSTTSCISGLTGEDPLGCTICLILNILMLVAVTYMAFVRKPGQPINFQFKKMANKEMKNRESKGLSTNTEESEENKTSKNTAAFLRACERAGISTNGRSVEDIANDVVKNAPQEALDKVKNLPLVEQAIAIMTGEM